MDVFFSQQLISQFQKDGYLILENFLTEDQCDNLRARCHQLVETEDFSGHPTITFSTKHNAQANTDYFLTSGDKIRYFFEEGAVDKDGKLKVSKHLALNKIGHALHVLDSAFKEVTNCDKVKCVAKGLGMKRPAIVQSMYIFKQPFYGGSVEAHQDSTFLCTTPNTLVGFWIALEDADIENSCLWFVPGSQKLGTKTRMVRKVTNNVLSTEIQGESIEIDDKDFIPGPVKKGTLVLIHGCVVHKSKENQSKRSRHIYTFHLYDDGVSEWSKDNWLQPTKEVPFPYLY